MSERYAFIDGTRRMYEEVKTEEQKQRIKEDIKKSLIANLTNDLDNVIDRILESPSMGIIDVTNTKFGLMLLESIVGYALGFFFSTIAMCGITAERLCMDILLRCKLELDGKPLQTDELEPLLNIPHSQLIELLFQWKIIEEEIKNKLHQIKDTRNKYIHPDIIPSGMTALEREELKSNALKILTHLKEVLSKTFPF